MRLKVEVGEVIVETLREANDEGGHYYLVIVKTKYPKLVSKIMEVYGYEINKCWSSGFTLWRMPNGNRVTTGDVATIQQDIETHMKDLD